jgi:hypothetical protein
MNRKLISNQPLKDDLEDLEEINFLQSRDKKVKFDAPEEQKQRIDNNPVSQPHNDNVEEEEEEIQVPTKKTTKRYHQLQVIDEDAEHFKAKLDNLINNFRTETLSEFMSIKRNLLEEQTDAIDSETRKYSKLLENRTNELDRTKEALAKKIKELERAEVITHVVADWSGIARTKRRNVLLLSKCFNGFKNYKSQQETQKMTKRMADVILKRKTLAKVFGSWKTIHVDNHQENMIKESDATLNKELAELSAKYNKEIELLSNRLNEALRELDAAERNKLDMQDNLKKAFMRGVCALNFEAMSILKPGEQGYDDSSSQPNNVYEDTTQMENIVRANPNFNSLVLNPVDDNRSHPEDRESERDLRSSPKKNIVFYQNPRLESKDMRWREAPLVGASQPTQSKNAFKESILKPSSYTHKVENKENAKEENLLDHHDLDEKLHQHHVPDNMGEGRVIKVNNGKSFGMPASHGTTGKSMKAQDKTAVTVNANKAAQLRSQLSKAKK